MSVIVGVALCAFGGLLVVAGVRRLGTAVSLYRTNAVPLRDVPRTDGPIEFEGQARSLADKAPPPRSAVLRRGCAVLCGLDRNRKPPSYGRRGGRGRRHKETGNVPEYRAVVATGRERQVRAAVRRRGRGCPRGGQSRQRGSRYSCPVSSSRRCHHQLRTWRQSGKHDHYGVRRVL